MSSILPPPSNTRLVTIVAQVDHGKTTLADFLVEHNGIISERLAGSMRFLDSLEEEQRRGITIRSSAIALKHKHRPMKFKGNKSKKNSTTGNDNGCKDMVIHLIDSPGHVDFSMEVSSALQICDGALLIVDVVEGMCARTQSILRESYAQKLVPILILNKIDRLCIDLGLNVNEAYLRIRTIIESVNAASSAMISNDRAKESEIVENLPGNNKNNANDEEDETIQMWTFEPSKGNVVFTTAIYGWGFTVPALARSLFKSKLIKNIKPPIMRQYLFGDFRYDADSGKVLKWKQQSSDDQNATMFAEYGLRPLWQCVNGISTAATSLGMTSIFFTGNAYYTNIQEEKSTKKSSSEVKISSTTPGMQDMIFPSLHVGPTVPDDAQQSLQTPKTLDDVQSILNKTNASSEEYVLRAMLRRHRPLSDAVLDAVCDVCPSPEDASSTMRKDTLSLMKYNGDNEKEFLNIEKSVASCNTKAGSPAVAHCSKFISTSRAHMNDNELFSYLDSMKQLENNENNKDKESVIILGVGRVLSGVLESKDVEYYCYGPKYNPERDSKSIQKKSIRLYLLMGSTFLRVNAVPAGHICAIHGLEELQLKAVTISDVPHAMPLRVVDRGIRPLVKVNVEAKSATDTAILEKGLAKLSLADPAVEVTATSKGERILACLGEIHLEQSVLDLRNIYCEKSIELRISEQIVEFGESTTWFENELSDFASFYSLQSPPLRQTLIPPYCYEDGISFARNGRSRVMLSNRAAALHVRVIPLSKKVYKCLLQKSLIEKSEKELIEIAKALNFEESASKGILAKLQSLLLSIDKKGNAFIQSDGVINGSCIKGITTNDEVFAPSTEEDTSSHNKNKDNEEEKEEDISKINPDWDKEFIQMKENIRNDHHNSNITAPSEVDKHVKTIWSELQGSCTAGFQAGCASGPLCEEPVRGILVVLEGVEIAVRRCLLTKENGKEDEWTYSTSKPISGGMVVASMKTAIRSSLLSRPVRLVEGILRLTLHSSLNGLGPLYAILSRRRGSVISDEMVDGTDLISIDARLPQSESFGLAPELLGKSSGEVTAPELLFSHWEILDEDPFWIPTSLEEREDFGEIVSNGDSSTGVDNTALKCIRMVRNRKGLIVDSNKIIVAAEKQRTLARKK